MKAAVLENRVREPESGSRAFEPRPELEDQDDPDASAPRCKPGEYHRLKKELKSKALSRELTEDNALEVMRDLVTPFHDLPYPEQLDLKRAKHEHVLKQLDQALNFRETLSRSFKMLASPIQSGHQHANEFPVLDGKVGFVLKSRKSGQTVSVRPEGVDSVKPLHVNVARAFEDFLTAHESGASLGPDALLTVKSNPRGDLLANLKFCIDRFDNEDQVLEFENDLKVYFEAEHSVTLTSLYVQHVSPNEKTAAPRLLAGFQSLENSIADVVLPIGPVTRLPPNLEVTPAVLECIFELLKPNAKTVVLDLHSDSDIRLFYLAPHIRGCIGIKNHELELKEATENAEKNRLKNCRFVHGPILHHLEDLLFRLKKQEMGKISVILSPGDISVNKTVIKVLKRTPEVNKIVYMCYNPEKDTFRNLYDLLKCPKKVSPHPNARFKTFVPPSKELGLPFKLVKSVVIDISPMTALCEHVFYLSR